MEIHNRYCILTSSKQKQYYIFLNNSTPHPKWDFALFWGSFPSFFSLRICWKMAIFEINISPYFRRLFKGGIRKDMIYLIRFILVFLIFFTKQNTLFWIHIGQRYLSREQSKYNTLIKKNNCCGIILIVFLF